MKEVFEVDDALFGHPSFRYAGWGARMWTWCEMIGLRRFTERYTRYDPWIREASALYQIPEALVRAVE